MPHGNPIDWDGDGSEDAEVFVGVESTPTKWARVRVEPGVTGAIAAQNLVGDWNLKYGGAAHNGRGRVVFPGEVHRTFVVCCRSDGAVTVQAVPDAPGKIKVAGLDVSAPV